VVKSLGLEATGMLKVNGCRQRGLEVAYKYFSLEPI